MDNLSEYGLVWEYVKGEHNCRECGSPVQRLRMNLTDGMCIEYGVRCIDDCFETYWFDDPKRIYKGV